MNWSAIPDLNRCLRAPNAVLSQPQLMADCQRNITRARYYAKGELVLTVSGVTDYCHDARTLPR